jgi:hypothetical protein
MSIDSDGPKAIPTDEAVTVVAGYLDSAISYIDQEVSPRRAVATDYYKGEPFGNEEDGRSKVVMHAVRTAIKKILPSLLRIFYGSERPVEFVARTEADVAAAEQRNDMMEYITTVENPGFLIFHSWFKDALIKRMGIVKWWWEQEYKIEETEYTGIVPEQLEELQVEYEANGIDAEFSQSPAAYGPKGTIDVKVTAKRSCGKVRFATVPPEEFLYSRGARSPEESPLVAHRTKKTLGELVEMGFPAKKLKGLDLGTNDLEDNDEELTRNPDHLGSTHDAAGPVPWTAREVTYVEAYCRIDEDGDGIPELRLYRLVGPSWEMLDDESEVVTEIPFAVLCPDPEPHTIEGMAPSDDTMDLQLVQSNILRGILDSLNLTLNPATEVVVGEVNLQDAQNSEVGKIIRVKKPGMIREVKHSFVGGDALPVMQYFDHLREERTGLPDAAAGLDADALQSSTSGAVNATITGAQQQIEMIARIFAETGVKALFRGLARLLSKHQEVDTIIRLRDNFIPVPASIWQQDMDVRVNVALGTGLVESKIAVLQAAVATQMQILAAAPQNPIVNMKHLSYTLRKAIELAGFKNSSDFYGMPTEEQMQPPEPQPDPQVMLIQAQMELEKERLKSDMELAQAKHQFEMQVAMQKLELEKVKAQHDMQLEIQKANLEMQLERYKEEMKDDRERYKISSDQIMKTKELELAHQVDINEAETNREVALAEASSESDKPA